MVIINIAFLFVSLLLYILQMKVDSPHSERVEKVFMYIQHEIVPTLILFSLINLSFSVGETGYVFTTVDSDELIPSNLASNLSLIFFYFFNIVVFCQYYRIDRQSLLSWRDHFNQGKISEISLLIWIMYKFALGFIMGLAHVYMYSLIALIILTVGYIIFTCILRPFRTLLLLLQHLYSELVLVYLFIILILYKSGMVNELTTSGIIPSFLLLIFILIGLIIMLVYGGYSLYKTIKYWMRKTPMTKIENIIRMDDMREQHEEYNIVRERRIKRAGSIKINRLHRDDRSENTI